MYRNVGILVLFVILPAALSIPLNSTVRLHCLAEADISHNDYIQYTDFRLGSFYDEKLACYNFCIAKHKKRANIDGTLIHINSESYPEITRIKNEFMDICTEGRISCGYPCRTYYDIVMCVTQKMFDINPILLYEYSKA